MSGRQGARESMESNGLGPQYSQFAASLRHFMGDPPEGVQEVRAIPIMTFRSSHPPPLYQNHHHQNQHHQNQHHQNHHQNNVFPNNTSADDNDNDNDVDNDSSPVSPSSSPTLSETSIRGGNVNVSVMSVDVSMQEQSTSPNPNSNNATRQSLSEGRMNALRSPSGGGGGGSGNNNNSNNSNTVAAATARYIADQIHQMPDLPMKRRGHRRSQSDSVSGLDENHVNHMSRFEGREGLREGGGGLFDGDRENGDALLSQLMSFGNGGDASDLAAELGRAAGEIPEEGGGAGGGRGGGGGRPSLEGASGGGGGASGSGGVGEGSGNGWLPSHSRSLSVDDGLLAGFNAASPPLSPPLGERRGIRRHIDGVGKGSTTDNLDEMDGEEAVKKVLASKKLQDVQFIDPKRAKRILANRQSAARSKERKTRYISELEEKVAYYEKQSTALRATLTLLQRETTSLAEVNEGMSRKMQMMEKLYRQREEENQQLQKEVELLRQTTGQLSVGQPSQQAMPSIEQQMLALFQLPPSNTMSLQQQQQQHHQQQQQQQQQHILALQMALQKQHDNVTSLNTLGRLSSLTNKPFGTVKNQDLV